MSDVDLSPPGATVVISHRIKRGKEAAYDAWLEEIAPVSKAALGGLDWQVIRPVPGLTSTFTVIIRFDTPEHLRGWIESDTRRAFIERLRPILEADDDYTIHSGLDFLFTPAGGKTPPRWKQALVTWSVIYPLALVVPPLVLPGLNLLGWAGHRWLSALIVTGISVYLVVYVIMPPLNRLLRPWLYRS